MLTGISGRRYLMLKSPVTLPTVEEEYERVSCGELSSITRVNISSTSLVLSTSGDLGWPI